MMFLLGMLTMYLITGIIILVFNTADIDEDIKDTFFGWWLIPIIIFIKWIKTHFKKG